MTEAKTAMGHASGRRMAIIKCPRFGVQDRKLGMVGLSIETHISEKMAAVQCLDVDETIALIKAYGVGDVDELHGQPIWVRTMVDHREEVVIVIDSPCVM